MGVMLEEKKEYKYSTKKRLVVRADLELYRNRTLTYLIPVLRSYGKEFTDEFNQLEWRAFGINDKDYMGNAKDGEYLFCMCKVSNHLKFNESVNYFQTHPAWVDDYIFSIKNNLHMFVFKNPRPNAIEPFLKGAYSKMFSKEDINRFFLKTISFKGIDRYTAVYSVLTQREDYFPIFVEKLKEEFNYNYEVLYHKDLELDFPPLRGEEIFNYDESSPYRHEYFNQQELLEKILNLKKI